MNNLIRYVLRSTYLLLLMAAAGQAYAQQVPRQEQEQPVPAVSQDTVVLDSLNQHRKLSPQAAEQPNQYEQHIRSSADLEIDGLIIDRTITKVGRDFYDVFQRQWEAPPMAKNYTITIEELPSPGNISIVSLSVNDHKLFEQLLQPRYDIVEEVATYMVGVVHEYLLNDQLNRQLEEEGKGAYEVY